jgi:hypothetical protein
VDAKTKPIFVICALVRRIPSLHLPSIMIDGCKANCRLHCFHTEVCDRVHVSNLLDDLEKQLGSYYEKHGRHYHDIMKRSKLLMDHMQVDRELDRNHIDYVVPPSYNERQKEYANFIARECILRGIKIDASDNFEDWRSILGMSISMEKYIFFLYNIRKWNEEGRETVALVEVVELLIPCILTLGNRVREKLVSSIIKKGLNMYYAGPKEEFVLMMLSVFQTKVFGTEASPSQWKLRYTKEDRNVKLEAIQLRNNSTRACLRSIDTIIEASVANDETMSSTLIIAMEKYKEALKLLTLHRELTEDKIEDFQMLIDDFFELWIGIFGSQGVTNYIHMLASGHVYYFLKEYKCLYLYSQQGWEALNGEIQTFIHQNSQRGGHNSGTKKGEKSYIYAVVQMIIRNLLWKTYEADKFYLGLERKGIKC